MLDYSVFSVKKLKKFGTPWFFKHVFFCQHANLLLKNLVYAVVTSQAEYFTNCFIHSFSEPFFKIWKSSLALSCNNVELYFMGFITFLQLEKIMAEHILKTCFRR